MESLSLLSPAKLNLYLRILRKRPDGYHDLLTLFHRISLCDRLVLRRRKAGFSLKCDLSSLPTDEENLVTRAYRLLQKRCPAMGGVSVRLYKRIPVGAGLGGGSSNAASFLLGMNRLYHLKLPLGTLMSLGRKLGADVPFFLAGVNQAIAGGRGDKVRPRLCRGRWRFLLLLPKRPLSTQGVYQMYRSKDPSPSLTKASHAVRMLCNFLDGKNDTEISRLMHNDLESAAFSLRSSIQQQIKELSHLGIEAVRMSGSGPTVFIVLPRNEIEARRLIEMVRRYLPSVRLEMAQTF